MSLPPAPDAPHDTGLPNPMLAAAGQTLTLTTLCSLFFLTVLPFLAVLVQGQAGDLLRHVLYAVATAFLLWNVWRGSVWSWRLTVGLSILAGFLVFVAGMFAGSVNWQGWLVSLAGLGFIGCGLLLVGNSAIRAFLDSRWGQR